jgi:CheY-like chemotaxis protein
MVLDSLVQALQAWGHTVFAGATGAQVLEQLGEKTPDLMVCDYRLGDGETGLDVIAAARARFGPRLPAIILTGDTDSEQLASIAATSIRVYPKPVPADLLQEHVHRAVKGA